MVGSYDSLFQLGFSISFTVFYIDGNWNYASPPCVKGEVHCFPRRQLIFSFGRRVIYHLKGLWEYIPKLIPSVCLYHDIQTNSGTLFLSLIFDVIHKWICLNELYKQMESFYFSNFEILFRILAENRKPTYSTNNKVWIFIKFHCVTSSMDSNNYNFSK